MKFGIGTAQFIDNYGYMKKKINLDNYFETLNKSKIDLIDTAQVYGRAQKIIGKHLFVKKKIVTKISSLKFILKKNKLDFFKRSLEKSLTELKRDQIYGLLFHDEKDIIQNDKFYNYIDKLKKNKIIKKFGYSTYNIYKKKDYEEHYNFDLIQAPFNLFDVNSEKIKILKKIKKTKEIHIRSVFLQGMVLNEKKTSNNYYKEITDKVEIIDKIIKKKKFKDRYQYILSMISNLKISDYCLIGCLNENEIIKLNQFKLKKTNFIDLLKLQIQDKKTLDLRNWN